MCITFKSAYLSMISMSVHLKENLLLTNNIMYGSFQATTQDFWKEHKSSWSPNQIFVLQLYTSVVLK